MPNPNSLLPHNALPLIDIFVYPGERSINPYWLSLGGEMKTINRRITIFYNAISKQKPDCLEKSPGRHAIIHIHWIPEFHPHSYKMLYNISRWQTEQRYYNVIKHFLFMRAMKRQRNARVIWTVHDADNPLSPHSRPFWTPFFHYWTKTLADAYIFHCRSAQKEFFESNPKKLSFVIPHGNWAHIYGPPIQQKEAREILGIPAHTVTFLILGWIRKSKNLEWLMPILKALPHRDVRFLIAGSPLEKPRWLTEDYFQDERFVFLTRIFREHQTRWLLGAADFLINAQARGYVSGSTINALSYNLPVISIDWGCISALISHGENGFLFTNENITAVLEQAIAVRHATSRYAAMRRAAFGAVKYMTWELSARKTLAAYDAILGLNNNNPSGSTTTTKLTS